MSDRTLHLIGAAILTIVVVAALIGGEVRGRGGVVQREPRPVTYWIMILVAALGAIVNALSALGHA